MASTLGEYRQTGFAESVRLGEIGQILESVKTVMEVRTFDAHSQQPLDLHKIANRLGMDEPLFRGLVLTAYEDGRWRPERGDRPVPRAKTFNQQGFRTDIVLQPMSSDILFTFGLPDACRIDRENESAFLNLSTGMLVRQTRPEDAEQLAYTLYVRTPDPELSRRHAITLPVGLSWESFESRYLSRYRRLPDGLDDLRQLAQTVVRQAEAKARRKLTDRERALALEHHLRDSGQYGYTLNLTIKNYLIDPVEDFLFNRKEGHCEYFATALALMLRSEGIPARVVSGFKGTERNSIKGCWEVQERHAHLWVEAWLNDKMWVTLDPTPADARQNVIDEIGARVGFWGRVRATTSGLWTDYVVNVNLGQQKRQLYGPLRDFAEKLWLMAQDAVGWGPVAWDYLQHLVQNPSEWFSVAGGLTAAALLLLALVLARCAFWLWRRFHGGKWASSWSRRRQQRLVVAFYDRFLRVVRRYGLRRSPAETPREFAASVVERLQGSLLGDRLEDLPAAVCAAYYRVRFGGEVLSEGELQALEQTLSRFEGQLRQNHRR
jgi:transglutaminase-like putative cysteine protease